MTARLMAERKPSSTQHTHTPSGIDFLLVVCFKCFTRTYTTYQRELKITFCSFNKADPYSESNCLNITRVLLQHYADYWLDLRYN